MKAILENAAVVGLIGVIIGSVLSFLEIMYTQQVEIKKINLKKQQTDKENLEKILTEFLHLVKQTEDFYLSKILNIDDFLTEEEFNMMLKNAEKILPELSIRASDELYTACNSLFHKTFLSVFNQKDYNEEYKNIIKLIKKELNQI